MGVLYEHWRLDTNECFYVGQSRAKDPYARAHDLSSRNAHHGSIVNKLQPLGLVEVRVSQFLGITKKSLNNLEILAIAHWKMYIGGRLTNKTNGGEGFSSGNDNPMKAPEISAKISGENHYIYKNPEKMTELLNRMEGDSNPAKRPEVGKKISDKKKGVPKPYFLGPNNPACKPGVGEKIADSWANKSEEEKKDIVNRTNATKAAKSDEDKALTASRQSKSIKKSLTERSDEAKAIQIAKFRASMTPEKLKLRGKKAAETRRCNKELKLAAAQAAKITEN